MDDRLTAKLLEVNATFYSDFAQEFAATRSAPWPGFMRLLPYLGDGCRILDVACGNGRLAAFLQQKARPVRYLGVDASPELVALARQSLGSSAHPQIELLVLDVTRPHWTSLLPQQCFDAVLALAFLQHVPGRELRASIVSSAAGLVSAGGVLVLCNWQLSDERWLRRHLVPWTTIHVDEDLLEPGDYLLDWRRGGMGYRYCHRVDEDEARALAASAGLEIVESFRADGPDDDLNHYLVLQTSR